MTFLAVTLTLFLATAFFTWALHKVAPRSDDVWPEIVDEEERQ